MRVLHLIPTLGGGGAERQIAYLAQGLHAGGCDVHVGIVYGGSNLERLIQTGATVHWIRSRGNYDPLLLPRIVRLVRRLRPDVVQTWLTQMDVAGGTAALMTGTPWLLSERAAPLAYPRDAKHRLRGFIGRFASTVVANSPAGLDVWTHSRSPRFVVPNAIPFDEIDATPADDEILPRDARIVLFAGRLAPQKNLPTLIAALAEVTSRPDVVAILCGEGELDADVRAMIAATGRGDRIRLIGFTHRLWNLMKRADAVVLVSWFEGNPNVVLEAIAANCPVVVSDIAEHRAFLGEEEALLVPPQDPAAIANAILRTLDDRDAARARAENARRAVQRWSIDYVAAEYARIYDQMRVKT
jgi:glycosyltransferase involved in cell wall biosynthesis